MDPRMKMFAPLAKGDMSASYVSLPESVGILKFCELQTLHLAFTKVVEWLLFSATIGRVSCLIGKRIERSHFRVHPGKSYTPQKINKRWWKRPPRGKGLSFLKKAQHFQVPAVNLSPSFVKVYIILEFQAALRVRNSSIASGMGIMRCDVSCRMFHASSSHPMT